MWFRKREDSADSLEAIKESVEKLEETESRSDEVSHISTSLRILRERNGFVEKLEGLWEGKPNV